jgi:hypothetical protein
LGPTGGNGPTGPTGAPSAYLNRRIIPDGNQLTVLSALGNASASFQYLPAQGAVTGTRIDALASWAGASIANANTVGIAVSAFAAIYSNFSSTLSSLSSGSTQTTYSYASNTFGNTELITAAMRPISCPVNFNIQPGEYLVGFNVVTATSSVGTATTNLAQSISMMGGNQFQSAINYAEFGSNTASSTNLIGGMGMYTVATTGLPGSLGLSNLAQTGASLSQANIGIVLRNV